MDAGSDDEFSPGEASALAELRASLKQVAEWPPDSPLSFVLMLAPRTRGKLGELLLARIATDAGLATARPESVAYDVRIGDARCEVKSRPRTHRAFSKYATPARLVRRGTTTSSASRDGRTVSSTG